uniref:Uncharacterized protein n=1 Tax=Thermorudis peleae TaxID=1382356 RepID=A0A831T6Q4_9BACT
MADTLLCRACKCAPATRPGPFCEECEQAALDDLEQLILACLYGLLDKTGEYVTFWSIVKAYFGERDLDELAALN